jgi:hypothetical protein
MDKITIINKLQKHVKELEEYKSMSNKNLNDSDDFSNLIYEIRQTINLDAQLKKHYKSKVSYFERKMDDVNSIINQILENFKKALSLIDIEALEKAKNNQKPDKRSFNIILEQMSIPFSNEGKAEFSANDMINCIMNYEYDIEYNYRSSKSAHTAIEKIEKLDMQHLYNYINYNFEYTSVKDLFNQSSEELITELKKILIKTPQSEFIYNYINAEAVILYFEFKKTDMLSTEKYFLFSLLVHELDKLVPPLIKTLEQLEIVLQKYSSPKNASKKYQLHYCKDTKTFRLNHIDFVLQAKEIELLYQICHCQISGNVNGKIRTHVSNINRKAFELIGVKIIKNRKSSNSTKYVLENNISPINID